MRRAALLLLLLAPPLLYLGPSLWTGRMVEAENDLAYGAARLHLFWSIAARGEAPLWNPYEFCGIPLGAPSYPSALAFFTWAPIVLDPGRTVAANFLLGFLVAAGALYLLCCEAGASAPGALLAALAASAGGFYVGQRFAGHFEFHLAGALVHLGLFAFLRGWRRGSGAADVGLSLAFAGLLIISRPEFLIQGAYLAAAWILLGPAPPGAARTRPAQALRSAASGGIGILVSSIHLLPFMEYLVDSTRGSVAGAAWADRYPMPPQQLASLVVPNLLGNLGAGAYWGSSPFGDQWIYAGVIPCLLAAASLLSRRSSPGRGFWAGAAALAALLMVGSATPVLPALSTRLPGLGWVRNPSRYAFLLSTALWILLAHGFDRLSEDADTRRRTVRAAALFAVAAAIGAAVLSHPGAAALPGSYFEIGARHGFEPARSGLLAAAALAAAAGAWIRLGPRGEAAAAGLAALILVDLVPVGRSLHRMVPVEAYLTERPAATALRASLRPGERYLWLGGPGWYPQDLAYQRLPSVNSHGGIVPGRYARFVAALNGDDGPLPGEAQGVVPRRLDSPLFPLLGVSQVLTPETTVPKGIPDALPFSFTLPRAAVRTVVGPREAEAALRAPGFDPRRAAVVEADPIAPAAPAGAGTGEHLADAAEWWRPSNDRIEVSTRPGGDLLVIRESFHPGWRATVDGRPAGVVPADLAFLGVLLPGPGPHRITLRFRPRSLAVGAALSAVGAFLLVPLGRSGRGPGPSTGGPAGASSPEPSRHTGRTCGRTGSSTRPTSGPGTRPAPRSSEAPCRPRRRRGG